MSRVTEPIKGKDTGKIFGYRVNKSKKSKAINKLGYFEDLQEEGKLLILPCAIGDEVYIVIECQHMDPKLDGTLWEPDGSYGTATGYYCPYENNCPFDGDDFEGCEKYRDQKAVFKDYVKQISTHEDGTIHIFTENSLVCGIFGQDIFLTREEAEKELEEKNNVN